MKKYEFIAKLSDTDIDFTTSVELILLTEVLFLGISKISFSSLKGFIEGITDDNNQLFLDKISSFKRYMELYGENKPFIVSINNEEISINEEVKELYYYQLLLLLGYEGVKFNNGEVTKTFEKITSEAIPIHFLGSRSEIVGAPSPITGAEEIANFLGINKIRNFSGFAKDKGLDIISYYPLDERKNKFILLTQCAAGKNWDQKVNDVDVGDLRSYLAFSTYPLKAFSIATILEEYDEKEEKIGFNMGLVFDRPRLYKLLFTNFSSDLNDISKNLVSERLNYFKIS